jgi:flagellar basal-body rod protein FlgF
LAKSILIIRGVNTIIRGLYTSAAGMISQLQVQDVAANNLANANTTGFKKDQPVFAAFPELLLHRLHDAGSHSSVPIGTTGTGVWVQEIATVHQQGVLEETGRELDFALAGEGFFVVETPLGRRYTRNGSFAFDAEGYVVTNSGHRVLGNNGFYLTGEDNLPDQLLVVNFPAETLLIKEGDSLFFTEETGQAHPGNPVRQGVLEKSNVNVVTAMVDMIAVIRAYEANQKAIQVQDQTLDKAVNDVGRV